MPKEEFIAKYLDREMKDHGLPFGLEYYNLLAEKTEKAERAWKRSGENNLRKRFNGNKQK